MLCGVDSYRVCVGILHGLKLNGAMPQWRRIMPELDGVCIEHYTDRHESSRVFVGRPSRIFRHGHARANRRDGILPKSYREKATSVPLARIGSGCAGGTGESGEWWRLPDALAPESPRIFGIRRGNDPQMLASLLARCKNDRWAVFVGVIRAGCAGDADRYRRR